MENQKVELCFYSPEGNFEVWDSKPEGYYTEDEWLELHPELKPKEPSLDELKEQKLGEIKSKFEASLASNGGVEVESVGVVNAGERHLKNCQDMLKVIGENEIDFRLFDNSFVKVNKAKLELIEIALINAGLAGYAKKWELELAVNNAKSKSALEKIKVEF